MINDLKLEIIKKVLAVESEEKLKQVLEILGEVNLSKNYEKLAD